MDDRAIVMVLVLADSPYLALSLDIDYVFLQYLIDPGNAAFV